MPKLYVLSGPDVGKSFEIAAGALVGRDPECKVRLRDPSVSRRHARVEQAGDGWSIVDTQSRNGIHVDGKRVPAVTLEDGAEFTLGEVLFRFRSDVASTVPTSTAPPASDAPRPASEPAPARSAPVPASPAREPSLADDEAEIVLEGEWSEPDPASMAQTTYAAQPKAPVQPTVDISARNRPMQPGRAAVPAPELSAAQAADAFAPRPVARETVLAPRGAATATPAGVAHRTGGADGLAVASRGVLQYQRVVDRPGLFNADLAQQPLWVKLVLSVVALIVFAAVFWFAFKSTSFLKGKTQHEGGDVQVEENG